MQNKAVFLDKDGVLTSNKDSSLTLDILPGVVEGLRILQNNGFLLVVVTNQSRIARNEISEQDFLEHMASLRSMLMHKGINIQKAYYCPHHRDGDCGCRKPKPGMVMQAAKENNIDIGSSYAIGDMDSDILLGKNAGCKTIFIKNKFVKEQKLFKEADYCCTNLLEAAHIIAADR